MAGENLLTERQLKALRLDDYGKTIKDGGGLSGQVRGSQSISVSFTFKFRSPETEKNREIGCGSWPADSLHVDLHPKLIHLA